MCKTKKLFQSNALLFLIYRLSSVVLVQTSYVPDEYWQSLEVAHNMAFGYGYLTWEWHHGLRSYIYPSLFAGLYSLLKYLNMDTQLTVTLTPRLAQACLTALSDYHFFKLCQSLNCTPFWTKLFLCTNWFWYFSGSRTMLNTFETSLTVIALSYYPWNIVIPKLKWKDHISDSQWVFIRNQSWKYLTCVGLTCIVRPTAVTIWAPLVLYQLFKLYPRKVISFVMTVALPIAISLFLISAVIDNHWYGKFTFPPYNFFIFNIYSGIASFYGSHSFHWYLTQGIPTILGLHLMPFLAGCYVVLKSLNKKPYQDKFEKICSILLAVIVLNILIFSYIPHKEFRFILPLLPMMEIIGIKFVSHATRTTKETNRRHQTILTALLAIGFIVPATLFGLFHQKGTLTVMNYLTDEVRARPDNASILFLTPCHATPLYSHLHVNVPVRFITCEPPLTPDHVDESEVFFRDPVSWLNEYWHELGNASHVVCFDTLQPRVEDFLRERGYRLTRTFMHTILRRSSAGDKILVYEL